MMELRNLRYAVTLARHLSFARAAQELCISQPALTRAIQSLEQRYDVRLFDRDRAGVSLTPQGRTMLDAAAALLANANDLERQWGQTAQGQSGDVRFGMAPMPAHALLFAIMQERFATAPGVRNVVLVRNVEALWPMLVTGEIEFFVAAEGQVPDSVPVRTEVLGAFPNSLVVRREHPLLSGEANGQRFPVLTSSRSGMSYSAGLQNIADGPPHVLEDFRALVQLTERTDAIWRTSSIAVAEEIRKGVLQVLPRAPESSPASLHLVMYSLERRSQSVAARSLKMLLRRLIRNLGEEHEPDVLP